MTFSSHRKMVRVMRSVLRDALVKVQYPHQSRTLLIFSHKSSLVYAVFSIVGLQADKRILLTCRKTSGWGSSVKTTVTGTWICDSVSSRCWGVSVSGLMRMRLMVFWGWMRWSTFLAIWSPPKDKDYSADRILRENFSQSGRLICLDFTTLY